MSKYTKEMLEPIVQNSYSIAQVIKQLGLQPTGGNYSHIGKVIDKLCIDRSHFKGQGHMKGKPAPNRRPTEDYLNNKANIHSTKLKKRLIKEGYFEEICKHCNLTEWMGEPIPLELHHINCNHTDNSLDNLMLLCPNCHYLVHQS